MILRVGGDARDLAENPLLRHFRPRGIDLEDRRGITAGLRGRLERPRRNGQGGHRADEDQQSTALCAIGRDCHMVAHYNRVYVSPSPC